MWPAIIKILTANHSFIISSHLNPDCDALGSELALAYHLLSLNKRVTILNSDPVIPAYQFLDPDNLIKHYSHRDHKALIAKTDVIIVLDASGGWERLGRAGEAFSESQATSICIDHHPHNRRFTHLAVIDTKVIATGELIFDLITTMGGDISPLMAQALYAAIVTDSGSFRFAKTSAQTHRITAELLEKGASPHKIYDQLYQQNPLGKVRLKGYVLNNIQLAGGGEIAYTSLDLETLAHYDVASSDLDTFSSLSQQIENVEISIFVVELPHNRVKISLRSRGAIPVNILAAEFGGGGHPPAAGATTDGPLDEVLNQLIEKAEKLLPEN